MLLDKHFLNVFYRQQNVINGHCLHMIFSIVMVVSQTYTFKSLLENNPWLRGLNSLMITETDANWTKPYQLTKFDLVLLINVQP